MRLYFWGFILLPILIFIIIFSVTYKPEINFMQNNNFAYSEFSDVFNQGNSISSISKTDSSLIVNCILKEGYAYPYSGIQFEKKDYSLYNINDYRFHIKLKVNYNVRLSFRMNQVITNYTDINIPESYLILVKSFGLNKGENELNINVSEINEIQDWWFEKNPKMINRINNIEYDQVKFIWLFTENSTPLNAPLNIEISEFSLKYNYLPLVYIYSIFTFSYYLIFLIIIWKVKKVKYILMPIELSKLKDKIPETKEKILNFIGTNFHNPDLNIQIVSDETGISKDHISELIKKHADLSFRQYLNQVRLEEAKNLLRNSDLQISEIAYQIGYNNIQHFNRVFKEYTSFSPKAFRDLK